MKIKLFLFALITTNYIHCADVVKQSTILLNAAYNGNYQAAEKTLKNGAYINVEDEYGHTALMWASMRGHTQIVELLLNAGADVSAKAKDAERYHQEMAKILCDVGITSNTKAAYCGNTALMIASSRGHKEIVKLLLNSRADVNVEDEYEHTALMWASRNGHKEIVKLLLKNKADVNTKNNNGLTALMFASRNGCKETVKLLLSAGADINLQDNDGWTALILASNYDYEEIIKLFEDYENYQKYIQNYPTEAKKEIDNANILPTDLSDMIVGYSTPPSFIKYLKQHRVNYSSRTRIGCEIS